jgi:hypothetical protein
MPSAEEGQRDIVEGKTIPKLSVQIPSPIMRASAYEGDEHGATDAICESKTNTPLSIHSFIDIEEGGNTGQAREGLRTAAFKDSWNVTAEAQEGRTMPPSPHCAADANTTSCAGDVEVAGSDEGNTLSVHNQNKPSSPPASRVERINTLASRHMLQPPSETSSPVRAVGRHGAISSPQRKARRVSVSQGMTTGNIKHITALSTLNTENSLYRRVMVFGKKTDSGRDNSNVGRHMRSKMSSLNTTDAGGNSFRNLSR